MCSDAPKATQVPIVLPELGSRGQPIQFVQWLVRAGDHVLEQDRVAEVLLGGVLFHVTAPAEGIIHHLIESEDVLIRPGDTLGSITRSA